MASILEKIKSAFSGKTESLPSTVSQHKSKKSFKKRITIEKAIENKQQLLDSVEQNGYHSIMIKSLFRMFGHQQRGSANIKKINQWLEENGLYAYPEIDLKIKWEKAIKIYKFPVQQLGNLFKSELEMEDLFVEHEWHKKLGLQINFKTDRQYKPKGTRDRLDFKAKDATGNDVVLELKHKGGDKRLIEQVYRYRSLLITENGGNENVHCVIITGNRCLHTARAIHGNLSPKEQEYLKWYLYKYDNKTNQIEFEMVPLDFIKHHFTPNNLATETSLN